MPRPSSDASPPWRSLAVGTRVVVRRRRDDLPADASPDEPRLTDLLGDLTARDDEGLAVLTRRGQVRVPSADVVLVKPVPPAPERRPRRG